MMTSMNTRACRHRLCAVSMLALAIAAPAIAQGTTKSFDIEAQPLSEALLEFSEQSEISVIAPSSLTKGYVAVPVRGELTPEQALSMMIGEAKLELRPQPNGSIVLAKVTAPVEEPSAEPFRLADVDKEVPERRVEEPEPEDEVSVQDKIVVTGTNIRGAGDQFSPVATISRSEIDAAGFATAAEVIASLPQNFGGGGASIDQANSTTAGAGASSPNLRGLGAEATLTLLNGRRLAPGGLTGGGVDISAIPLAALERVEVLSDGASAIYGSDAVAGVVNFVLRDDFIGNETRLRLGTLSQGDGDSVQASHTFGAASERANILLSYEYFSEDALDASDREFAIGMGSPGNLLPKTRRNGLFGSGAFQLNQSTEIFADAYVNERRSAQVSNANSVVNGVAEVLQYGVVAGARAELGQSAGAELSASYSRSDFEDEATYSPLLSSGLASIYGETTAQVLAVEGRIDASFEGVMGRKIDSVLGVQYREESHDGGQVQRGLSGSPISSEQLAADNDRSVMAAFGELLIPLFGEAKGGSNSPTLSLNLAGRYEHYSDFGDTFNPKVGMRWEPVEDFALRGTYSTSFRAPRLQQLVDDVSSVLLADFIDPGVPSGESVALLVNRTSSDLGPEESTSWTVGFDLAPSAIPGMELRATYYSIDYEGRIGTPGVSFDSSTFRLHDFEIPAERNVDQSALQSLVDASTFPLLNATFFPGRSMSDLSDVTVLLDVRPTNTARSKVDGVDISGSYSFNSGEIDWSFFAAGSVILDATDQFSELQDPVSRVDTTFNPSDIRIRGGATASSGFTQLSLALNYVDDYRDDQVLGDAVGVDEWLTVDASIRADLDGVLSAAVFRDASLTLGVRNLFDRDPPSISTSVAPSAVMRQAAYDSANADPQGRVFSIQLTKSW